MLRSWALGLLALVGCTNDTLTVEPDPVAEPDGEKLFRANCAECHGDAGEGNELGPQILSPVDDYFIWVTRNGRGPEMIEFNADMPAYPKTMISDAELDAIVAFLDTAVKPTTGQELYGRYCANCHGVDGGGGRSDEALAGKGEDSLEIVREGHSLGSFASATKYMPAWSSLELTNQDVALIDAYLATLPEVDDGDDDDDDDHDDD